MDLWDRVMPKALIICFLIFIPAIISSFVMCIRRKHRVKANTERDFVFVDDSLLTPFALGLLMVTTLCAVGGTVQWIMEDKQMLLFLPFMITIPWYIIWGYYLLKVCFWKVHVINNEMVFRNSFGITRTYRLENIRIRKSGWSGGIMKYVIYTNNKDLFSVHDSDMKKYTLLFQALENLGIKPTI